MAWPKGMPRIGHVNKDGTKHKPKGKHNIKVVRPVEPVYTQTRKEPVVMTVEKTATIWGATSRAVIEPCSKCNYAYADGGYCPECGETVWNRRTK